MWWWRPALLLQDSMLHLGQHGGVISTVATQQQGPGFKSTWRVFLCGDARFPCACYTGVYSRDYSSSFSL